MPSAKIHVTKLAAAERQLRTAIRMYFGEEDDLAIHTVASAAYRLLADLKVERGMDEAADSYLASIFGVVRAFRRGSLPEDAMSDPEFMAWVTSLAEQLPIQADTRIEDVSITLSRQTASEFWNKRNKIANFLKHADRDSGASIDLEEVDNLLLLMQCYGTYTDVTRDDLGNEGFAFKLFISASEMSRPDLLSPKDGLVQKLAKVPEKDRRRLCFIFITEQNNM